MTKGAFLCHCEACRLGRGNLLFFHNGFSEVLTAE